MENIFIKNKLDYYIVLILSMFTLIWNNYFNKLIIAGLGLVTWTLLYMTDKERKNTDFVLLKMLTLSVPLSFINIFGGLYSESILSWFNIIYIIIIFRFCIYNFKMDRIYFDVIALYTIFFLGISIIPVLVATDTIDALKQYLNIAACTLALIIGSILKYKINKKQITRLQEYYIGATEITALGVFIQFLMVKFFDNPVGYYVYFGGYRHAFGFLFADFSFLSLYLSSGAAMLYFTKHSRTNGNIIWIVDIVLLLLASILTSARTGIVSFLLIFCLFISIRFFQLLLKGSIKTISITILGFALVSASYFLMLKIRSGAIFSGSGRNMLNHSALNVFYKNPLTGIGFGMESYRRLVGMISHNIIYQSLAQGGLILTIALISLLLLIIRFSYKKNLQMLPILLCILLGSLFIPNIFHSRFLTVIFIIVTLNNKIIANKNELY